MQKPGLVGILLEYSEPLHNSILTYIQNPVVFAKIEKPCVTLEIQNLGQTGNPGIFRALAYLQKHINTV